MSATGPVAIAPVLGEEESSSLNNSQSPVLNIPFLSDIIAQLPPPLDIALLAEYDDISQITLLDRISALGLLLAWLDFGQEDDASWERYDKISAEQLFRDICKVSPVLYAELVVPLLHVLPMTTGYDCSAAAALSCFHVFALQCKGAFDVRWCRGSIADLIFRPWAQRLVRKGVQIRGSCRLTKLQQQQPDPTGMISTTYFMLTVNENEEMTFDAVVLAIGSTAAKRLAPFCGPLSALPYREWKTGITCVAVRLFLDRDTVPASFLAALKSRPPVTVCGPKIIMPTLIETGFCVYDLTRLQDGWRTDEGLLVLEVDFFRANAISKLKDEAIVEIALDSIEKVIAGSNSKLLRMGLVLDFGIVRAKDAVSHFSIGAAKSSPPIRVDRGIYMCGDWIDRKGHASWSTEKAVVTGIGAAKQLANDFGLSIKDIPSIIPSSQDSRELRGLRESLSSFRKSMPSDTQKRLFAV